MELVPAHTTNTRQSSFENSPEALDVIAVNVPTDHLAAIMVNVLVEVSQGGETAIHFERVGTDAGTGSDLRLNQSGNEGHVELSGLNARQNLPRIAAQQPDNGQFVGSVPWLRTDTPDVQAFILPLATNVRFVDLDRAKHVCRHVHRHDSSETICHDLGRLQAHADLLREPASRPFTEKDADSRSPSIFVDTESIHGISVLAPFATASFTFPLVPSQFPVSSKSTIRTGCLRHIGGKLTYSCGYPLFIPNQRRNPSSSWWQSYALPSKKKNTRKT